MCAFFKIILILFFSQVATAQFKTLHFQQFGTEDGLPATEVYRAVQDKEGHIWFATDRGISRYDGYDFTNFTVEDGLTDNSIIHLTADQKGRIWCIGLNRTICYIEDGEIYPYRYNHLIEKQVHLNTPFTKVPLITELAIDSAETVFLGLTNLIISIAQNGTAKNKIENIDSHLHFFPVNPHQHLRYNGYSNKKKMPIYLDSISVYQSDFSKAYTHSLTGSGVLKTNAMYSAKGIGDNYYISSDSTLMLVSPDTVYIKKFPSAIASVAYFGEGKLWIGLLKNGVMELNPTLLEIQSNYLEGFSVSSILEDSEGGMWFTTLEGGVFYTPSTKHYSVNSTLLKGQYVRAIDISPNGRIAVGYGNRGPMQFIKKSTISDGVEVNFLLNLLFLSEEELLCNCQKTEIHNLRTGKVQILDELYQLSNFLDSNLLVVDNKFYKKEKNEWVEKESFDKKTVAIRAIYIDSAKSLYAVGWEGAYIKEENKLVSLAKYDSAFAKRFDDVKGISNRVFFASSTKGLLILQDDSVFQIGEANGLSSNIALCLEVEDENHIWVGTNKGLNLVDLSAEKPLVHNLNEKQGLVSNEVTAIKLWKDTVWVGTKHGISYFHKKDAFLPNPTPIAKLLGVQANDSLFSAKEFPEEFSHNQNKLTFRFSALSFRARGEIDYQYRLLGLSDKWEKTTERQITFSSLPFGEYIFEVDAGFGGKWTQQPTRFFFTIHPAFWQTIWFIALCVLAFLFVIYTIYQQIIRKIHTKNELDKQISQLKSEALKAQVNPHFMFNALNSIQKFVAEENTADAERYLARFGQLLRNTLDYSSNMTISLSQELDLLESYLKLEKLRFKEKLNYTFLIGEGIDTQSLQIPPLLLQPFIENSLLHGILPKQAGGNVRISIREDGAHRLECAIEDDGVGRQRNKSNQVGHESKGLAISQQRLRHLSEVYKTACRIEFEDKTDGAGNSLGTKVSIFIPQISESI